MGLAPLTREQMQAAVDALAEADGVIINAAKALNLNVSTYKSRLVNAEAAGIKPNGKSEAAARIRKEREKVELQDRVRDLEAQIKAMHRDELNAEAIRQSIFNLAAQTPKPPSWIVDEPKKHSGISGVPSVLWSDWHWGEVVDPAQVNNANEYNLAIAHARIKRLVGRTVDICFKHMVNPNYPGIVVNLGGDMISGDIHEELSETNELPTMPVLLDLFSKLIWALKELINAFGRVFVVCEYGNHGRNTKKPRAKNRAYTNFDWLLYNMLERHFADVREITFHIPTSTDAYYRVYGHRYLLTHGDAIGTKGGDGIIGALGPILRGDTKIRSSSAHMGMPYDTLLMGHWHQYLPLFPRVCVNGSLKGYDEFAKDFLRAPPEPPQQSLWFTHPRWGVTYKIPVRVDDNAKAEKQAGWVSIPQAA